VGLAFTGDGLGYSNSTVIEGLGSINSDSVKLQTEDKESIATGLGLIL
jgi:hypothetical protein